MAGVVLNGSTSGSVTLDPPAVAGSTVITLPSTSGTMALAGGAGSFTTLAASGESVLTGNVGLGVTPSAWSIYKGIDISTYGGIGSDSATFILTANTYNNGTSWIAKNTGASSDYIQSAGAHTWRTAPSVTAGTATVPTTKMTLDAKGSLEIGNGTNLTQDTGYITLLGGSGTGEGPRINGRRNSVSKWNIGCESVITNSTSDSLMCRSGSTGGVLLAASGTSWSAYSDERMKDIIEPIENAVEKTLSLRAVIGKYKDDEEGTRRPFLIAQDVQSVLPEAVIVGIDEQQTLSLAYTEVIPLLVAAIKELKAEIDLLKGVA